MYQNAYTDLSYILRNFFLSLSFSLSLSTCSSICLSIYVSSRTSPTPYHYISLAIYSYTPIFLSIYLSIHLSVYLSIYLPSIYIIIYLSIYLRAFPYFPYPISPYISAINTDIPIFLSIYLLIYPPIYLSIYLSIPTYLLPYPPFQITNSPTLPPYPDATSPPALLASRRGVQAWGQGLQSSVNEDPRWADGSAVTPTPRPSVYGQSSGQGKVSRHGA